MKQPGEEQHGQRTSDCLARCLTAAAVRTEAQTRKIALSQHLAQIIDCRPCLTSVDEVARAHAFDWFVHDAGINRTQLIVVLRGLRDVYGLPVLK